MLRLRAIPVAASLDRQSKHLDDAQNRVRRPPKHYLRILGLCSDNCFESIAKEINYHGCYKKVLNALANRNQELGKCKIRDNEGGQYN